MENISKKPLAPFPPDINFETRKILKALASANQALAELKNTARSLPNQGVLIDMLSLQEALSNASIRDIITTQGEVLKAILFADTGTKETNEAAHYKSALRLGYDAWCEQRRISSDMLIMMFRELKQRSDGYRQTSITVVGEEPMGKNVYEPPHDAQQIPTHMHDLETFINDHIYNNKHDGIDPLIKMALIHHQFESIHPFPDGNGRIGRILNVLYLIHTGLLDVPILYLSQAINRTMLDYHRLLQAVRNEGVWEDWVVYMLDAVAGAAKSTLKPVTDIRNLMQKTKHRMQQELKCYSQNLLDSLFRYPYMRIDGLAKKLGIHHNTAARYVKELTATGFLTGKKYGAKNITSIMN